MADFVALSQAQLPLLGGFLSPGALRSLGRFATSFFPPETSATFLRRTLDGSGFSGAMG